MILLTLICHKTKQKVGLKCSSLIKVAELLWQSLFDTDCQVLEDISDIFNYAESDKLGMIEDGHK